MTLHEDFETGVEPGEILSVWNLASGQWHVFDNGVGTVNQWTTIDNTANPSIAIGTRAAYINRENIGFGNTSEDWLVTPEITVPTGGILSFMTRLTLGPDDLTLFQIRVAPATAAPTDMTAYTTIAGWGEADLVTHTSVYQQKYVNLAAFAGQQVYIAFVRVFTQPTAALGGDRWLVDNVEISGNPMAIYNVTGQMHFGFDTGNCETPVDTPLFHVNTPDGYAFGYGGGQFGYGTDASGFSISAESSLPYFTANPPSYDLTFTTPGEVQTADFCFTPNGDHADLRSSISGTSTFVLGVGMFATLHLRKCGHECPVAHGNDDL